jgi:hypothetical protein
MVNETTAAAAILFDKASSSSMSDQTLMCPSTATTGCAGQNATLYRTWHAAAHYHKACLTDKPLINE